MRFCNLIPTDAKLYKRDLFHEGLKNAGLTESHSERCDVLLIWNRYGDAANHATWCEQRGGVVLVAENASWGNDFAGERWYTLARGYHNTAGMFPVGGHERWDSLGVNLAPWRADGGETVVLLQRGIGPQGMAMPARWESPCGGRVRQHPGMGYGLPLEQDLAHASKVVTWGSGAAIKALMWGIRVESHMPRWIGEQDNTDAGRLAMLRRLAWAQWRVSEIASGEAFQRILDR